jgi:hypothetical protein
MPPPKPSNDSAIPQPPESSCRKRPVSERRVQANRKNALRSTGPKTERGKCIVARNAVKHGFLAREVVITAGEGEETLEEFHSLAERLCEYYAPVGVIEELLVQTIATCWWRKARVIRAENGEIRRRLDTAAVDLALRNSDEGNLNLAIEREQLGLFSPENRADHRVSTRRRWLAMQIVQSKIRGHHSGLTYLSALLQKAKAEIASEGYISDKTQMRITGAFCFWDFLFALACSVPGPPVPRVEGQTADGVENKQAGTRISNLVALIDDRLERISLFQKYAGEREEQKQDSETRSFSLPPAIATDKLLRYEAHLDRQLYRAMDQLERMQRQRWGDNVPPPVNINLGQRTKTFRETKPRTSLFSTIPCRLAPFARNSMQQGHVP